MKYLFGLGQYLNLLGLVLRRPIQWRPFFKRVFVEMNLLGIDSLPIIAVISVFMGAVITIQTASNIDGGLIPAYTVGFATRQSVILEFSPTILALILVGKVGSSIASELGTMRVTEQIDALDIMGINSANYLILPKVVACVLFNPFLITISMALGILGGYVVSAWTGLITIADYELGIQLDFRPFHYSYAIAKTLVFAFIITSVPAFFGYYVKGGSVEVGKASTRSVVVSSIAILISNYFITNLILI